jgi:hypothetical protein
LKEFGVYCRVELGETDVSVASGEFDNVMDDALTIALQYLDHTIQGNSIHSGDGHRGSLETRRTPQDKACRPCHCSG